VWRWSTTTGCLQVHGLPMANAEFNHLQGLGNTFGMLPSTTPCGDAPSEFQKKMASAIHVVYKCLSKAAALARVDNGRSGNLHLASVWSVAADSSKVLEAPWGMALSSEPA
jgi:hypothetical protein